MPSRTTRRRVLTGLAAAGTTTLAGCSLVGSTRHTLKSDPENGADPVDLFRWRPASNAYHYDESDAEALAEELRETGSVESIEIPLVEERPSGEDGYRPAYTEIDGTYHRVHPEAEAVTLDRWVVWMEPLDELPDGVDYTTSPREGRSELDAEILDRAISEAVVSHLEERDHAAQRAYRRGVVFFDPLSPADSDLVPDPPFEYARIEPEGEFGPDELALRLHAEEEAVETTRYTHSLEPIADGRETFVDHVDSEHVAATFSTDSLSADEAAVLDESTALTGYDEKAPPSEAFASIQSSLSVEDVSLPQDREVASWLRFYARDGDYYEARFRISDDSLVDVEMG
ncbi:hypothetical protein [Natronomonas amylolytica]|uniref:hypothetical protein n=1 Tax=Natronomonas amylolytica TaxID=3108498 RepID=UPI0030086519